MIELFKANNEDYSHVGDIVLAPISCEVFPEVNGPWELQLFHPIDAEGRWTHIEDGAVLRIPSFNGSQRFRIVKTEKRDGGIQATARPQFLDAAGDNFIIDKRPTNATGQEALNAILTNSKYSGLSNITTRKTAFYVLKNAMEAIAGEDENSFINRWGGEIEYNNYQIIVNQRLGQDNGVQILYGKNIPQDGLRETIDVEQVITRIVPKAYNGRLISGDTPWVDSEYINTYPTIKTAVVEYPDIRMKEDTAEDTEGIIVCETQAELDAALTAAARGTFEAGADRPVVSITCDMVLLQNAEAYEDIKELEKVSLGDTVHCYHSRLGIDTTARIVSLTWDAIRQQVTKVTIGDVMPSFISRVTASINATEKALTPGGEVRGENIAGIINGANARVIAQAKGAEAQKEKVILFEDLDPESATFGAMALGTTGFMISDTRTADGTDWEWSTFGTGKGFSADLITAGVLSAISIDLSGGGRITDLLQVSDEISHYIELSTGQIYQYSRNDNLGISSSMLGGYNFTPLSAMRTDQSGYYSVGLASGNEGGRGAFDAVVAEERFATTNKGRLCLDSTGSIIVEKGTSSGTGYTGTIPVNRAFTVVNGIITGLA